MAKMTMYILLLSIPLLLFHFAGLITSTGNHWLLSLLLGWELISNSSFYAIVFAGLSAASIAGVVIGSLITARTEIIIKAATALALMNLLWDIIALGINVKATAGTFLATMLFAPFIILFILTTIEWLTGRD